MGADSQVTANENYTQIQQEKILKFNIGGDDMYLCFSGDAHTATRLKHFFYKEFYGSIWSDITGSVFNQIQEIFIDFFKFIKNDLKDIGIEVDLDFYAIIIFKGKLIYYSAGNYEEIRNGQHIAFGSGAHFALGAMDAGASVKKAIQIACNRDIYSGGHIDVIEFDENRKPKTYLGTRKNTGV